MIPIARQAARTVPKLGRNGEHSWTNAVQQAILGHGDASSQLDLSVST
jgi:hypothetical protein